LTSFLHVSAVLALSDAQNPFVDGLKNMQAMMPSMDFMSFLTGNSTAATTTTTTTAQP